MEIQETVVKVQNKIITILTIYNNEGLGKLKDNRRGKRMGSSSTVRWDFQR